MIGSLISLISSSLGVSPKIARIIVISVSVLSVFSLTFAVKSCYDNSVINRNEEKIQTDILKEKVQADERASEQRAKDSIKNSKTENERREAIDETESQPLTDSSLALGCVRLRQQGYNTDDFPECSGR